MKITTKYHGEMEFEKKDIWYFANGIPGFPNEQQFILYPLADNEMFSILQSVASQAVAFVVTSPFAFFPDYDFTLEDSVVSSLKLESSNDVLPLVILTLGESLISSTANLQAPLIFNMKNKQAKQVILHNTFFHTKHPLKQKVKQG